MLLLAALASLTAPPLETPSMYRTYPIAATDVQIRLPLAEWREDTTRLQLLRKGSGEHVLTAGHLGTSDEVRLTLLGGPAPEMSSELARQGILGDRLLGMGISTIAGHASAEGMRMLNPPYREFDRHAFLLGANAMAHIQIVALEQADPEKFGDAGFEKILAGARFAVVRRTEWDDLPARYLELSQAASPRVDGLDWLRAEAALPGAGWIEKLAAVEHAHAARSTDAFTIELGSAVRAELLAKTTRIREEDAGLLLAEDGLGIALLRADDPVAAEEHLQNALALAPKFGDRAVAGVTASLACARAVKKDVDGVVQFLEAAYAKDPTLRYRLQQDPLLASVRTEPRVAELLKIVLKPPSNRSLGSR